MPQYLAQIACCEAKFQNTKVLTGSFYQAPLRPAMPLHQDDRSRSPAPASGSPASAQQPAQQPPVNITESKLQQLIASAVQKGCAEALSTVETRVEGLVDKKLQEFEVKQEAILNNLTSQVEQMNTKISQMDHAATSRPASSHPQPSSTSASTDRQLPHVRPGSSGAGINYPVMMWLGGLQRKHVSNALEQMARTVLLDLLPKHQVDSIKILAANMKNGVMLEVPDSTLATSIVRKFSEAHPKWEDERTHSVSELFVRIQRSPQDRKKIALMSKLWEQTHEFLKKDRVFDSAKHRLRSTGVGGSLWIEFIGLSDGVELISVAFGDSGPVYSHCQDGLDQFKIPLARATEFAESATKAYQDFKVRT